MLGGKEKMKIIRWPQIVFAGLMFINLGIALVKHGEPKEEKYNFFITLISVLLDFWILKAGGFF